MALIEVNFEDVPDEIQPVEAGVYTCLIDEVPEVKPTKDGAGEKIVVTMKIDNDESPMNGRRLFDHISMKYPTRFKRLCKSAGLNPGAEGVDTSDLLGKHVEVQVTSGSYTDPDTGQTKPTSNIKDYVFAA